MKELEKEAAPRARERLGTWVNGKYRLDRILGFGGMATVYAATHRNQAEFAVKMLHSELSILPDVRSRFLREGYVANSVRHPGAVLIVDDDVAEDGTAFLVMELLRGAPMEELWTKVGRRVGAHVAVAVGHQLLDVLATAHQRSIIHRDIKPANLFVTDEGMVKVLDFGIARLRDLALSKGGATKSRSPMGTPAFMSPEQARAEEVDEKSDVWAVGATLFTLLTGRFVHDAATPQELLIAAATKPAPSLVSRAPSVPLVLAQVIDRALKFDKNSRWPSALMMRDALRDASLAMFGDGPSRAPLLDLTARAGHTLAATLRQHPASAAKPPLAPSQPTADKAPAWVQVAEPHAAAPAPPTTAAHRPAPTGTVHMTATPVSSETMPSLPTTKPSPAVLVAVGGACVVALGIALMALRGGRASPSAPAAVGLAQSASLTSPMESVPPPPSDSFAASEPPSAASASAPPLSSAPLLPSARPTPSAMKAGGTPKPDCAVPYTLDANGFKKWKLECLTP